MTSAAARYDKALDVLRKKFVVGGDMSDEDFDAKFVKRSGNDFATRLKMGSQANRIRDAFGLDLSKARVEMSAESPRLSNMISTRMSVEIAGLLSDGFGLDEASEIAVYPFFDADGGLDSERTYIKQLVQKYLGGSDEELFTEQDMDDSDN